MALGKLLGFQSFPPSCDLTLVLDQVGSSEDRRMWMKTWIVADRDRQGAIGAWCRRVTMDVFPASPMQELPAGHEGPSCPSWLFVKQVVRDANVTRRWELRGELFPFVCHRTGFPFVCHRTFFLEDYYVCLMF